MDYHRFKSALNHFLLPYAGGNRRPVFYDIDRVCPALRNLERAYPRIRAEADALLARRVDMPSYDQVNPPSTKIAATTHGRWNVFLLELLGQGPEQNRALCPATCAALARMPGRLQAFFSVMEPGKQVPLHVGPYVGYLRYHLGVHVPAENPPRLRVAGKEYVWKDGEGVMFDDSWPHEVINPSDEPRVVLIVDVPQPFPLLPRLVNPAVLWGAAAPLYGRKVVRRAQNYHGSLA